MPGRRRPAVLRALMRGLPVVPLVAGVSVAMIISMVGAPPAQAGAAVTADLTAAPSTQETYQRPDWVSAALAARLLKRRVEDTSQRTELSQTFANADGTVTTETNQLPVRVESSDGAWKDVDTTLVAGKDGVTPNAVPQDLAFSNGGDGPLVTLGGPGKSKVGVSWPTTLPTPTLAGDTATYPNAVPGADGDLVLQATSTGFELSMVLRSAPASALSLSLPVALTGLTASKGHGGVALSDAKGNVVVYASAGQAFDATTDAKSGESKHQSALSWGLGGTKAAPTLTVSPDQSFLTDPSTVYPVTLDPSTNIARSAWTYVQSTNPTTSFYNSSAFARVGSPDGTELNRSLFAFTQDLTGKHILSATLQTLEAYSSSCTASPVSVYSISGFDSSTTWNTQPSVGPALDTQTVAKGFDAVNCPQGSVNFTVTTAVAADVAASQTTYPFELRSATTTESDVAGWKKFANNPTLSVTYNTPPLVPDQTLIDSCTAQCASPALTRSGTPNLRAVAHDVDGGFETLDFEVWAGSSPSPTTMVTSGTVSSVNSNAPGTWKVPSATLSNGSTYEWRVRGDDGTDTGPWTSWYIFTVDTTAPAAPSISSTTWPSGAWTSANTGSISWSDTSSDLASYTYQLDANNPVTVPTTTTSFTVTSANALLNGPHTFKVTATDNAGNQTSSTYSFNVGQAALTSPSDGDQTAQKTLISAAGPSTRPWVTYRYSTTLDPSKTSTNTNPALGFAVVPVGNVVIPGTTTHPASWPQQASGGVLPSYTWDLKSTVTNQEPVRVEACLGTSSTDSSPVCSPNAVVTYNEAIQNANTHLGPGSVDLLTGDMSLTETDAAVSHFTGDGLSVGRALTTKLPSTNTTGATGIFGPGWIANLPGPDAGDAELTLTDNSASTGVVTLTDTDATVTEYQLVGSPSTYPVSFTGKGDASADGSVLTKTGTSTFTLTDADGTTTTWTKTASAAWVVSSILEPGGLSTSYSYDGSNRVTQIIAPAPAPLSCASAPTTTIGCRTLTLAYATTTTATTGNPGDYAGRIKSINYTAADPAHSNVMNPIEVAHYAYDTSGRLVQEWDPRLDHAGLHVMTQYSYISTTNRLQTYTPPGLAAWTIAYDASNRVSTVSRVDPVVGTATSTLAYGVSLTGGGSTGLPDLNASTTATWGQTSDLPATGTAVFPPDHIPASTPTASDWPYASISYLDTVGRTVDSAAYGAGAWQIDTSTYAPNGNLVRSLDARGRAEALDTSNSASWASGYANAIRNTSSSATRAGMLDTENTYDSTGVELIDTLGPIHQVRLDNGSIVDARAHAHTDYDQGAPSGGPYYLPTNSATSAQTLDGVDHDTRSTVTGYGAVNAGDTTGWSLRAPTRQTVHMGGSNDIVTITRYNPAGQVIESRLPGNQSGGGAGSTLTTYYSASGSGTCLGSPVYAGMLCQTAPAAQPSGGPLPTTGYTYDLYGNVATKTETYGSTGTARTTTLTYDNAERPLTNAISTIGSAGTSVPTVTDGYDVNTGLPTTQSTTSPAATITTGYDTLGRVHTYTDATGNVTTTGYDIDGRVSTVTDGKGTSTYTYDSSSEHRSMVTSLDTGMGTNPSVFTATYDASGDLATQTYPSGLVATTTENDTGNPIDLRYAKSSTWMEFTRTYTSQDQAATDSSPQSAQSYAYDPDARLNTVEDTVGGSCTTRVYAFDPTITGGLNSNRTSLSSYPQATGGACSTSTTATVTNNTYDSADRITNTGYTYDDLGRTLTIPSVDAGGSGTLTNTYYANDMAASLSQGAETKAYSLDPARRLASSTDTGGSAPGTATNHYASSLDRIAWTTEVDGTWTRDVIGPTGALAVLQAQTGTPQLQLIDLDGNVVAAADDSTSAIGVSTYREYSEFGLCRDLTANPRFGWLGSALRASTGIGGVVALGVRLYLPSQGRFLQADPMPEPDSTYIYAHSDPLNLIDLDGNRPKPRHCGWICNTVFTVVGYGLTAACTALLAGAGAFICKLVSSAMVGLAKYSWERAGRGWKRSEAAWAAIEAAGLFTVGEAVFNRVLWVFGKLLNRLHLDTKGIVALEALKRIYYDD